MTKTARLPLLGFAIAMSFLGTIVLSTNVNAVDYTVTSYEELAGALSTAGSDDRIVVDGDITLDGDATINSLLRMNSASTLDLNGHTMTLNGRMAVWADTTITGNGHIESNIENPINVLEGNLIIENGNFYAGINTYAFIITYAGYAGNIYIRDGDFDISNIIVNNYGSGEVVVSGGSFVSHGEYVDASEYADGNDYSDAAFMTSYAGKFEINGEGVEIDSHYRFLGDKFISEPEPEGENRGEVICTLGSVHESIDVVSGVGNVDYYTNTVCGFNLTQDSDDSVDGTDSYRLLNTNYTIAKGATLTNNAAIIIVGKDSVFTICGTYSGDEDSLITEDNGSIVRRCEGEEENPNSFDGIHSAFVILAGSSLILTGYAIHKKF